MSTTENTPAAETAATLLTKMRAHCEEINQIAGDYREEGTYGCSAEAAEIMHLVQRLRALLGLPS